LFRHPLRSIEAWRSGFRESRQYSLSAFQSANELSVSPPPVYSIYQAFVSSFAARRGLRSLSVSEPSWNERLCSLSQSFSPLEFPVLRRWPLVSYVAIDLLLEVGRKDKLVHPSSAAPGSYALPVLAEGDHLLHGRGKDRCSSYPSNVIGRLHDLSTIAVTAIARTVRYQPLVISGGASDTYNALG